MSDQDERGQLDELFSQVKSPEHAFASDRLRVRVAPDEADRFRALIEHLPVGVYRVTPGGSAHVLIANQAFCDLLGVERQDVLSQVGEVAVPDQLLTPGRVTETEMPFRRPDGAWVWRQVISREMCALGGQVVYYDCVVLDITRRKHAEHAAELGWWSRLALDALPDAMLVVKPDRSIAVANAAAEARLGYARAELERMSAEQLYPGHGVDVEHVLRTLAVGQVLEAAFEMRDKQGQVMVYEHTVRVMTDGRGRPVAILAVLGQAKPVPAFAAGNAPPARASGLADSCVYLGLPHDSATRYSYPSGENFCHAALRPQPVEFSYQADTCMSGGWADCPRYTARARRKPRTGAIFRAVAVMLL